MARYGQLFRSESHSHATDAIAATIDGPDRAEPSRNAHRNW
jgi:hypothetical protein